MNEDVVVTRDAGANLLYEDEAEAEAVRAAFRKKLGQRECRRARLALMMRSTLGVTAREALKRARFLQWHAYPVIKYDFVVGRWFADWE